MLHICLSLTNRWIERSLDEQKEETLRFYCSVLSMSVNVFTSVTYKSHYDCPPLFKDDTLVTLDSTVQLRVVLLSII